MRRAIAALAAAGGWRRHAAALLAGALSTLALAPFHLWFVMFATYPVLVWLVDGGCAGERSAVRRMRAGATAAWFFGFGYFLAGLYWIGHSFLVEAEAFAWLMPFAVMAMPAGLALFYAAAGAGAGLLWRSGLARIVALALAMSLAEIARGTLFTGLPWNTLGYALAANDAMMQWASLFGVYGLTFLATAVFAAPAAVLEPCQTPPALRFAGPVYALAVTAVLAGGWAWGTARLGRAGDDSVSGVRLRIVQPNIPQSEKWKPDNKVAIFRTYLDLSRRGPERAPAGLDDITHLVWPESALPFLLADSTAALSAIADLLPEGTTLITGQARAVDELGGDGAVIRQHVYNSLFVMNDRARIVALYDKLHLVPFGEYLPFQGALEAAGMEQLTRVRGGFTAGATERYMTPPGAPPMVPLICYEIIFPHAIRQPGTRPEWMLNVTNDAWFGVSTGPYQHFHQARVRGVEQGLPVVRAANTGISAVIDPYGRIVASRALGDRDAIDAVLPERLPETIFFRMGAAIEIIFSFIFAILWIIFARGRARYVDV